MRVGLQFCAHTRALECARVLVCACVRARASLRVRTRTVWFVFKAHAAVDKSRVAQIIAQFEYRLRVQARRHAQDRETTLGTGAHARVRANTHACARTRTRAREHARVRALTRTCERSRGQPGLAEEWWTARGLPPSERACTQNEARQRYETDAHVLMADEGRSARIPEGLCELKDPLQNALIFGGNPWSSRRSLG
eukprot:6204009-Pleurochrysis_carterae.AAC.3